MSECDDSSSLTTDEALDLLCAGERRRALSALRAADGSATLGDLAAATVARAKGCDPEDVTTEERERAAASLHHSHLPRLADASVIEYDPEKSTVALTELVEELRPYFDLLDAQRANE